MLIVFIKCLGVIICWCQKAATSLEATFFLVVKAGEDALKAKKERPRKLFKKELQKTGLLLISPIGHTIN